MNKKIILGITAFNHDASACLIKNGKIIAFSEEERFNGVKHTNVYPSRAIEYCLSKAQITKEEITDVAYYFNPTKCILSYIKHNNPFFFFIDPTVFFRGRFYYEIVWLLDFINRVKAIKKHLGNKNIKMHYIDHHIAHIWYGYYSSGFKNCIVLSNDSVGEDVSTMATMFTKSGEDIKTNTLIKQYDPNSLGYMYGAVTEYLGFQRGEGEGRVMALASFGKDTFVKEFKKGIKLLTKGRFKLTKDIVINRNFQIKGYRLGKKLRDLFGKPRAPESKIDQIHYDISHAVQKAFEYIVHHQLEYLTKKYNKIVLTGGVAQNSVMNGIATETYRDTEFFVPPITNDAGCSLGAAIYVNYKITNTLPKQIDTAFLGQEFSDTEIVNFLNNNKIKYTKLEDAIDFCAKELNKDKVIGFFRGPMECGPRALCNRSIIASPKRSIMRDHLNNRVKYREIFRPYGGFIKSTKVDTLFKHNNKNKEGPYMTYVYDVKDTWLDKIPALVHIDNTCRVQIINDKQGDKFLIDLLNKFEVLSGIPILINTSMNLRGYPIAQTPSEAIGTFYTSAMDYMLFNNKFLVKK